MDKNKIAEILVEIGMLLKLKGGNPFKTRVYSNAARVIENPAEPPEKVVAEDRLTQMKGIADAIGTRLPWFFYPTNEVTIDL
jgi:DNA polymerase (family 10)